MITNIIFLDIDGVLNSRKLFDEQQKKYGMTGERPGITDDLDDEATLILQNIVKETNAKIVISSTWRFSYYDLLVNYLKQYDIEVIGRTKRGCADCVRGNEILTWIKDNDELIGEKYYLYKNYVILDDDSDMLYWQRNNFIHINNDLGLTKDNQNDIIRILKG